MKKFIITSFAAALLVALAGCSSPNGSNTTSTASPTNSLAQPPGSFANPISGAQPTATPNLPNR